MAAAQESEPARYRATRFHRQLVESTNQSVGSGPSKIALPGTNEFAVDERNDKREH
jgi:hypothetical protein